MDLNQLSTGWWLVILATSIFSAYLLRGWFRDRRVRYIEAYQWPPGLMDKLVYNHMAKEPDSPLKKSP